MDNIQKPNICVNVSLSKIVNLFHFSFGPSYRNERICVIPPILRHRAPSW
jgi:hypothetical protein